MLYVLGGKEVIKFDNKVTITCKGTLPAEITRPDRAVRFDYENTGEELQQVWLQVQTWWGSRY